MAYNEYFDLFLKAQATGKYHMIVFDVIDSKNITSPKRAELQRNLLNLMQLVYNELHTLELTSGKDILLKEEGLYRIWEAQQGSLGYLMDPLLFGDAIGFTINRDTLAKETLVEIWNRYKAQLGIDVEFHIADGFYETNDYSLGKKECFRGYCFQILETYHKEPTKKGLAKTLKQPNPK